MKHTLNAKTPPDISLDDERFVFIDQSPNRTARLYRHPRRIIQTDDGALVSSRLDDLRKALDEGAHVAGFLTYEAGVAIQPRCIPYRDPGLPLLWFGVFDAPENPKKEEIEAILAGAGEARIGRPSPRLTQVEYARLFDRLQNAICAGDIYQANLTYRAAVQIDGDPVAAFAALRRRAQARHAALVHCGSDWLLSLSPESFFDLEKGRLTARPMKGTAPRRARPEDDGFEVENLAADPKQQAENLMIVDLIRNDLGRVAIPGTVGVPALFEVETYPTVHQLTSTVHAELKPGLDFVDVLKAAFPCGSITGAPKIRAMELIASLETSPRGAYCGSIGWASPDGDAGFNVAIRTLHLGTHGTTATLGLGSGIVADSLAEDEWEECATKARFLSDPVLAPSS